ncbi:hypothetical protein CQA53_10080 [Helicobacter didelphidarum]|uniref:Uncharacterized protein n=1 Tax=Helicobacter didelphidarum TaxID=2040648 RepID=A0A3D8I8H7_9HELI|nr:hypothetical protein [Helicobacter didelphidarum]RDU61473.1 hypothetical protein CQA53_10080 [Helicobacter didelphidarum]
MAIGKVISKNVVLFPDFDDFEYGKDDEFWEMELFLQIQNITKTDILEYFEYIALGRVYRGECDSHFVPIHYLNINNEITDNDPIPTYISEYINIVGQLFLAGYIEFGMCVFQGEDDLLSKQKDQYQAWIYFRDNFFYTEAYNRDMIDLREKYPNMSDDDYLHSNWDTPQYWDMYRFWVARTEKGTKYFDEILCPRFYKKYKDLEVEIDDKGNIVRWIGEINR